MKRISTLLLAAALAVTTACGGDPSTGDDTPGDDDDGPTDPYEEELNRREVDYNAALRIAALRLVGDLPTMTEINEVANAPDNAAKKVVYEARITEYMTRPAFARQ